MQVVINGVSYTLCLLSQHGIVQLWKCFLNFFSKSLHVRSKVASLTGDTCIQSVVELRVSSFIVPPEQL